MVCDAVILATGVAVQHALPGLDWKLPMANKPGIILKTNVLPQVINHTLMTPDVHVRQNLNGGFTAGEIPVLRLTRTWTPWILQWKF